MTRRDFLASGLIKGSGFLVLPSALDILLNNAIAQAQAAGCVSSGRGGPNMPALITIDATGGACFAWDIPPLDSAGNLLPAYGKLGLGSQANLLTGLTAAPFANTIQRSGPGR